MTYIKNHNPIFDNKTLGQYLCDISKLPLLDANEEVELAIKIKKGNKKALAKLVKSNLRFVVSIAKEYRAHGLPLSDVINEGNVGLIKAAQRFDETKGFKFISYAVWWVRQSILQAIADNARVVRLPVNKIGSINKVGKACKLLEQEYEREPTLDEIAQELDVTKKEISQFLRIKNKSISLDEPIRENEQKSLLENTVKDEQDLPDTQLMEESLRNDISYALESLTKKESDVVCMYFGIGKEHALTLDQIGAKYRITRERVRQIKDKAITRLRHQKRCKLLKQYLG